MTQAFHAAIEELTRQAECRQQAIKALEVEIDTHIQESNKILAELNGMLRGRDLLLTKTPPVALDTADDTGVTTVDTFAVGSSQPIKSRMRQSVQKVVMALIGSDVSDDGSISITHSERSIVNSTGLPADSVHVFLLRAVREGKLVKNGEMYSLPPSDGQVGDDAAKGEAYNPFTPIHVAPEPGREYIENPDRDAVDRDVISVLTVEPQHITFIEGLLADYNPVDIKDSLSRILARGDASLAGQGWALKAPREMQEEAAE